MKICNYEGCSNIYKGSEKEGLCREHYLLSTKDKEYTSRTKHGRPKNTGKCNVESCQKDNYSMGFCNAHYSKFKKYGDPLKVVHKTIHCNSCAVLGCPNQYYLNDYCQKHYWRNQRYGDPQIVKKVLEHPEECSIKGCKKKYYAKYYCKSHYMIYEYGKVGNHDDIRLFIAMNNVRNKYNNTCQWYKCGKSRKNDYIQIHVHHIFPQSEYPELKYIEEYMICYCKFHHAYWHEKRGDFNVVKLIMS